MLTYSGTAAVSPEQFRDVLVRSTLGERRPIDDPGMMRGMVEKAALMISCWDDGVLVGIARSVTDFHYCCYLSDLAVDTRYQKQGIGRRLIEVTHDHLGPHCKIILLAAPAAEAYYGPLGFEYHPRAWMQGKGQLKKSPNNSHENL